MAGGINAKLAGEKLRTLRKKRGETAAEVASAVGVVESAILNYECGYRVPKDRVKSRLADHYGVSLEWLFFAGEAPQEEKPQSVRMTRKEIFRILEINFAQTDNGAMITLTFETR
jgi:transcriptional regulator with XRE-family HTH domain